MIVNDIGLCALVIYTTSGSQWRVIWADRRRCEEQVARWGTLDGDCYATPEHLLVWEVYGPSRVAIAKLPAYLHPVQGRKALTERVRR